MPKETNKKPESKNAKFIVLSEPVKRGNTEIKEITLLKPSVGALRGMKMSDLLQMDVEAGLTLLPRITAPSLTKAEIYNLDPSDFTDLISETVGFFIKTEEMTIEA